MTALRLYYSRTDSGTFEMPVSDRVEGDVRDGSPLFDLFKFSGQPGDVRFDTVYLVNESPDHKYRYLDLAVTDSAPGGQLDAKIDQAFTTEDKAGNTIDIPASMVGQSRLQFVVNSTEGDIVRDPTAYSEQLDLSNLDVAQSGNHYTRLNVIGVIEPGHTTATYNDIRPSINGVKVPVS